MRYLIFCLLMVLLSACGRSEPQVLRVGYNNWPGYELIWLADQLGYFKEADIRVEHVQFVSLSDARRAYERGNLDAVGVTGIELLQIADHVEHPAQVGMVFL